MFGIKTTNSKYAQFVVFLSLVFLYVYPRLWITVRRRRTSRGWRGYNCLCDRENVFRWTFFGHLCLSFSPSALLWPLCGPVQQRCLLPSVRLSRCGTRSRLCHCQPDRQNMEQINHFFLHSSNSLKLFFWLKIKPKPSVLTLTVAVAVNPVTSFLILS